MFNNIKEKLSNINKEIKSIQNEILLYATAAMLTSQEFGKLYYPYENGKNIYLYAKQPRRTRNLIKAKRLMCGRIIKEWHCFTKPERRGMMN